MATTALDTRQKALQLNLDPTWYGTFAEIGAGQEVVRWFFQVGAAAGTVAKSMSAYDMTVSDAIYGQSKRYVSRERLESMLAHEYALDVERLDSRRGEKTCFFAFADTVATCAISVRSLTFLRPDHSKGPASVMAGWESRFSMRRGPAPAGLLFMSGCSIVMPRPSRKRLEWLV